MFPCSECVWSETKMFAQASQAKFSAKIIIVRERMESREREIHGEWLTEEKLAKSEEFSACPDSHI